MSFQIVVADDFYIVRLGLRQILQASSHTILGEATTVESLLSIVSGQRVDVILTNFRLGGKSVLESLDELRSSTQAGILFFSGSTNPNEQAQACLALTGGFVSWSATSEQLLAAVQAVAAGQTLWTGVERRRLKTYSHKGMKRSGDEAPYTPREFAVVQRVVAGDTNKQIADSFKISAETVKEHIQNAMHKSGLSDRTQLAVWAVRNGWA